MKYLAIMAACLFATDTIAQTVPPLSELSPWAQLGAVGILGWITILLVKELREQRKDAKEVSAAHTKAMENVGQTMLDITRHCAEVQSRLRKKGE